MHEKESHEKEETVSVNTSQLVLIGLAALFLMGAFQTWQLTNTLSSLNALSGLNVKATGANLSAAAGTPGALDMTGWTANEKMNYEMHGIVPARAQGTANASSTTGSNSVTQGLPSQVGGC